MSENVQTKKTVMQVIFSKGFLMLFISYLLACLCFSSVGSVFVTYGSDSLGIPAVQVGAIAGMVSMIGMFMRPVTAILVDKFNRKKMLALGYLMLALSCVMLMFVKTSSGLYAAQIIRGVAWALQNSAGFIMVGEVVGKEDLGTAMSVYSLAQVVASSFSAVLMLAVANGYGFDMGFAMTAVFTAISFLLAMAVPYVDRAQRDGGLIASLKTIRLSNIFSVECLPILVISFGFQFASIAMGASWIVKFAKAELNVLNAGLFATVANLIMYVTKPLFGKVMDKYGARWCVVASGVGFAISCVLVAFSTSMSLMYVSAVVYGLLCGGNAMAARTMAMKRMPLDRQAVAGSTVGIGNDIGMTVANIAIPLWAGMFGSYKAAYLLIAGVSVAVVVYSLVYGSIYLKRDPKNEMHW